MFAKFVRIPWGSLASARHPGPFLRVAAGAVNFVACGLETRRQLRALSQLDDYLLRDIGLSREDVERACSRLPHRKKPRRERLTPHRMEENRALVTVSLPAVTLVLALVHRKP